MTDNGMPEDGTSSIQLPEEHPAITPFSFLLGRWVGTGKGDYPTIEPFDFFQELTFSHIGKPYLIYTSRSWRLAVNEQGELQRDERGEPVRHTGVVRPLVAAQRQTKPKAVTPRRFSDAQEIGDLAKANNPVIVNLQANERELARRMIDFCSGVTYALAGSMDKVADQVFLLTPSNVEVSAEEKRRLQERGLYRS